MTLQLADLPIEAKSLLRPDLNEFVDKVGSLERPSLRKIASSNLRLLEIAFSELPLHLFCRGVREPLEHALMCYHAESIVVNRCVMFAV